VKLTEIRVFDNVCDKFGMTNLPFWSKHKAKYPIFMGLAHNNADVNKCL